MPLYEYQCQNCGTRTEVLQSFSDAPLTTCESCGGTLKKLLSSPAVQFKGSGWYVTDYAGKGKSKSGSKDGGGSSGDSGDSGAKSDSGGGSSDSKSESKSESKSSTSGSSSSDSKKSSSGSSSSD